MEIMAADKLRPLPKSVQSCSCASFCSCPASKHLNARIGREHREDSAGGDVGVAAAALSGRQNFSGLCVSQLPVVHWPIEFF